MPSIPQSLLWISLVVLWLFVLVPMLISKRDAVRRTSDVALATRVLNGAARVRKLRKGGAPAAGHRSNPDWQPGEDFDDEFDSDDESIDEAPKAVVVSGFAKSSHTEADYLDVDIVEEDSGALPVGSSELGEQPTDVVAESDTGFDTEDEYEADEYEYVEDTSGLEAADDPPTTVPPGVVRRRRYDATTAAAVSARKYRFRKRVLFVMALALVASAALVYAAPSTGWRVFGTVGAVTVVYLVYLRRQTRIEQQLRRRRMQRMARSRLLGVENTDDNAYDLVPSRLRRPGAVVLEIDDEDPIFEHLDYAEGPVEYHLPRAAGQ